MIDPATITAIGLGLTRMIRDFESLLDSVKDEISDDQLNEMDVEFGRATDAWAERMDEVRARRSV